MCGIAGIFQPGIPPERARIEGMLDSIAHRGPDGRGVVAAGDTVFGHVRLSILDLTDRAAQPMWSHDGRYLLTYNGEVYNFTALRSRLEMAGVELRSTGDTETLLEHMARFGLEETLRGIEGFFAFGLWDARDSILTLARDRLGKKPLYWSSRGGSVRFASELKALADGTTRPDLTTLDAMLMGFPGTWGRSTPLEDVETVESGSTVQFRGSANPVYRRWFSIGDLVDPLLRAELDAAGKREVLRSFDDALRRSLGFRMVSDVPVASLVSGGVDSSLVTVMAAAMGRRPELYHADVVEDSERPAAEAVAAHVGGDLNVARVTDGSLLRQLTRATWFNDAPLTYHVNAVPFLSVCERAGADGVKVLLSGEGSDEFFLGYPKYGLAPYLEIIESGKARIRRFAQRGMPRVVDELWPSAAQSKAEMLRQLVSRAEEPLLDRTVEGTDSHLTSRAERRAHTASLALARAHLTSLLHRNDRLGMAAGIENRFPFLGNDLTRMAVNLPVRYKLRWVPRLHDRRHPFVVDKWLVRELASRRLPPDLAMREKRGFPVRVKQRLRVDPAILIGGFVSEHWRLSDAAVREILARANPAWQLGLALVEIWGRQFIGRESFDDVADVVRRHMQLRRVAPGR